MATDETLLALALELAESYDPTLDTSEGSSFRTKFLNPLLTRVGGSPLDGDIETFLIERLQTEIPEIDVSPLSGMRDLVIRAAVIMFEPLRREINSIKLAQSLSNYQLITTEELNALLANFFTEIQTGAKAVGTARMYFPSPRSVTVTPLTQFSAGNGLNFFPTAAQTVSSAQMSFNQEGSLFYMDVSLEAENPGTSYNLDPGGITTVVGISGVSKVTNLGQFRNGIAEETKDEAVARTRNSITIRNLITRRGVEFVIPEAFPNVDTLQVIGMGDPEMDRDVVFGPVNVSDIPGGLTGKDDPGLGGGERIHIGGHTDIYAYQAEPDLDDLDIEDFSDKGFRVYSGTHGYTDAGSPTTTFRDDFGFFDKRGVVAGDELLIDNQVIEIAVVNSTDVTLASTLPAGLFEKTYEIVRKVAGQVTVPLYDLVAVDSDGNPVIDDDDDPICPIPGSLTNSALTIGGTDVKKSSVPWTNISRTNIKLPLLRGTTVEVLDPITLEPSGVVIPMRDFFLATTLEEFTGGSPSTKATGTVRVCFRDAVSAWVTRSLTRFVYQSQYFQPIAETQGLSFGPSTASGTLGGNTVTLTGNNFTSTGLGLVYPGYRIEILSGAGAGTYTVTSAVYTAPDTILTIREDLPALFSGVDWLLHVGVNPSTISYDSSLNFYYFDVQVQALVNGAAGNLSALTNLSSVEELVSEGWTIKTSKSVLSFSVRELPYVQMSEWVNDTLYIGDPLDAPAFRISYEYAGELADIQTFADDSANRIVAEDVLIRHFLPAYVRSVVVERGVVADDAKDRIVEYVNTLSPTEDLEISDVVNDLYEIGVTKVQMPLYMTYMGQDSSRNWFGIISQDTLGSSRIQHFVADQTAILVTQES